MKEKEVEIEKIYSLSPMQEGMLFHYLADKSSRAYFEQNLLVLQGDIDRDLLEKTFSILIGRYEILRTIFRFENVKKPLQIVLKQRRFEIYFEDLSLLSKRKRESYIGKYCNEDMEKGFNLTKDILLRITLFKTGEYLYELLWSYHHILMDGWCLAIIFKDLITIYSSLKAKQSPRLKSASSYNDYINWLKKRDRNEGLRFWKRYLEGYDQQSGFSKISHRQPTRLGGKYEAKYHWITLSPELTDKLKGLVRHYQVTMSMVFQSIWGILLHRISNLNDVVYGVVVSGRDSEIEDIENMVGLFINTVPLRLKIEGDLKFSQFLDGIRQQAVLSKPHEYIPLADIQAHSLLKFNLIDHIMAFENYPFDERIKNAGAHNRFGFKVVDIKKREQLNYDFCIVIVPDHGYRIKFIYNHLVLNTPLVEKIACLLEFLIRRIVEDPERKIAEIEIIPPGDKRQIMAELNNVRTDYPRDRLVHELFSEQVTALPDKIALVHEGRQSLSDCQVTYRELNRRAETLAGLLVSRGIRTNSIVGLMVKRSPEMMEGILGILKAGGAYLSIGFDYPEERKRYMIAESGIDILLSNVEIIGGYNAEIINLGGVEALKAEDMWINNRGRCPGDVANPLAYVIYTSGSTGKPKGVMVDHRCIVRLVKNTNFMNFDVKDRFLQTGVVEFDASTLELWGSLLNGLSLYLVDLEKLLVPETLLSLIRRYDISVMWMTSPLFNQMVEAEIGIFKGIGQLLVGGDVLSPTHINKVKNRFPGIKIINGYGPTENTTFSTTFLIDKEYKQSIPIGRPISNSTVYVADLFGNLQPPGFCGELLVGGDGVARGYLNQPQLSAERFVSDLFISGVRVYRTGDLVRRPENGPVEFLGRIDNQVKIRGFRIELEEIESVLLSHKQVNEAVVVARESGNGKYLCGYFVSPDNQTAAAADLRGYLSQQLPDYMIPSFFIAMESLPLTANGKIDRRKLPEPEIAPAADEYAPPENEIEERLVEIWSEVLGLPKESISIDEDFFQLGGHSLKVTVLVSKIFKVLKVKVPIIKIFETPTVRELARYIKIASYHDTAPIVPVETREYYPLSSAQKRLFFLQRMNPDSIDYNVPMVVKLKDSIEIDRFEATFLKLIHRHESLRTSFILVRNNPVQKINKQVDFSLRLMETVGEAAPALTRELLKSFDLGCAPLMRSAIVNVDGQMSILFVDTHHIVTDGVSMDLLLKEFLTILESKELPPLKIQYKDYSCWQQQEKEKESIRKQEEYWLTQFKDPIPILNLPTDYPRPKFQSMVGDYISFEIDRERAVKLKSLAAGERVTLFMVLLAVCNILFSKIGGQEDIVIGTTVAGRRHVDLEPVLGMFVNTLAIRNYPRKDKVFIRFLKETGIRTIEAFENQEYQFEDLVARVVMNRDPSRNPLFDVLLEVQNFEQHAVKNPQQESPDLKMLPYKNNLRISKFDIDISATEKEDRILVLFDYNSQLFSQETIRRMAGYFMNIVDMVTDNPNMKISEIELLKQSEKNQILKSIKEGRDRLADKDKNKTGTGKQLEVNFNF